jgi:hypothetical protein
MLVNRVRARAGMRKILIGDVASKEAFRDVFLRESGWAFISQGRSREDFTRQKRFI